MLNRSAQTSTCGGRLLNLRDNTQFRPRGVATWCLHSGDPMRLYALADIERQQQSDGVAQGQVNMHQYWRLRPSVM
jgi:hypothetical protein